MNYLHLPAVACVLLLLAGCATAPPQPAQSSAPAPTNIADLNNWALEGKLGIRHLKDSGSLYITWQQNADHYIIDLAGTLGIGSTHIEGDGNTATIQRSGEPAITHSSADELVERYTGWVIPVTDLAHWAKGQPAPDSIYLPLATDETGRLQQFEQSGWQITYHRFSATNGLTLPEKITATQPDTKVTLVIKSWQTNPSAQ